MSDLVKGKGDIEVFCVDLCCREVKAEAFIDWLDDVERNRVKRFLQASNREQFVGSHLALRYVLAQKLQVHPSSLEFEVCKDGKPWIKNTRGVLHFSLSHSGGRALIAVSRTYEVGADIEEVKKKQSVKEIANRFFSSAEAEKVTQAYDAGDGGVLFCKYWVLKEAVLKAWGVGLRALGDVEINATMTDLTSQSAKYHSSECYMQLMKLDGPVEAAVAWLGGPATVHLSRISLEECLA